MRRLRKVHIIVSSNFYDLIERERRLLNQQVNKKVGVNFKNITIPRITEVLADRIKMNGGRIAPFKKQKRRCI